MEETIKARYRNKKGKVIIEVFVKDTWRYVKTLGDPLKEFSKECLEKVSLFVGENKENIKNNASNVRLININRTTEKDTNNPLREGMSSNCIFETTLLNNRPPLEEQRQAQQKALQSLEIKTKIEELPKDDTTN